jgi:hypothetical protein
MDFITIPYGKVIMYEVHKSESRSCSSVPIIYQTLT